jgi:hypothetical protein
MPDTPIRTDDETHHPDTLNFSCPHVAQRTTRSHASPLPTIVEESSPSVLEVPPPPPAGLDFCHVVVVQESEVDEKLWHIARVPYNFSNACWAMHAVTKKKCTAKIVSNSKSTLAPTYLGVWKYYKFIVPKIEKFFFAPTTMNVVSKVHVASGWTYSLLTKNDLSCRKNASRHSPLQHFGSSPGPLRSRCSCQP